jgi:hypothetical protein
MALGQHVRYMWRWDQCHVAIFSPFLILPSLSLTHLSLYLLIPIQNDGALESSIPTAASSCRGERREKLRLTPVMEHAERYGTKGSCGRARTAFFKMCIARFSLRRGEQSGNNAKTVGSTKQKTQNTKLTKQSTTTK